MLPLLGTASRRPREVAMSVRRALGRSAISAMAGRARGRPADGGRGGGRDFQLTHSASCLHFLINCDAASQILLDQPATISVT
jgi:hypothetical protein